MAFCVMKFDSSLCEVYVDTYCDVSDDYETEILESDSVIRTTPPCQQSWSCLLVLTSESETSTVRGRK
jgi:hypothetical protein